jgi:hypothetical protein
MYVYYIRCSYILYTYMYIFFQNRQKIWPLLWSYAGPDMSIINMYKGLHVQEVNVVNLLFNQRAEFDNKTQLL